ncbi:MAG: hypothetical protein ACP5HU_09270 [Phycisphaerae bacterium]
MIAGLFTHPVNIDSGSGLLLMLPLLAAVAIVYKAIRVKDIRKLPKEVAVLMVYMVLGLVALGVGLWLVQEYWP